jgi:iron complex transport system substrate-binding protein
MMRRILYVLVALLAACTVVASPVSAADPPAIPSTPEEVHAVAHDALADGILQYMRATYLGEQIDHPDAATLQEAWTHYPEYPRRIVDSVGAEITIYKPLQRIVAYNYHWVYPLDSNEVVVGVCNSAMSDALIYPSVTSKINVGGGGPYPPDIEKIFACDPDAVLTYTELGPGPEFFEAKLPASGEVSRLDFIRPETLREEMLKLGYLLDRTGCAQDYVAWFDRNVNEIEDRLATIPEEERVRVFLDIGAGQTIDRRTVGYGGHMHYHCTDAGGINVAADSVGSAGTVNAEWILQQNPDIILALTYDGGYEKDDPAPLIAHHDELGAISVLQNVPAVKNDRVYCISYKYAYDPHYPAALATIAKWLYPEHFADIDPAAIHQEYIDTFLGVDYKVAEHGVYGYPEDGTER